MRIVPVLDIFDNRAVRAVRGDRRHYAPLRSIVAPTTQPVELAATLLAWHPFDALYVADLNAIQGLGACHDEIRAMVRQHAAIEFWIDAAFATPETLAPYRDLRNVRYVIGSETLTGMNELAALRTALGTPASIALSLDFMGREFRGPAGLWASPERWPDTVIAMNLARVGAGEGPDHDLLADIAARAPHCRRVAAGGVRGVEDLARLANAGVAAALLASALHDGRINREDLARLRSTG